MSFPLGRCQTAGESGLRALAVEQRAESHRETRAAELTSYFQLLHQEEIKDGHCFCQGHLIATIYFWDLLIAEVCTRSAEATQVNHFQTAETFQDHEFGEEEKKVLSYIPALQLAHI